MHFTKCMTIKLYALTANEKKRQRPSNNKNGAAFLY